MVDFSEQARRGLRSKNTFTALGVVIVGVDKSPFEKKWRLEGTIAQVGTRVADRAPTSHLARPPVSALLYTETRVFGSKRPAN